MATEPEVLITLLLKKSRNVVPKPNWVTKLATCTRPRPTSGNITVCRNPRWLAITESGNNVAISLYIVVVPNAKRAYA